MSLLCCPLQSKMTKNWGKGVGGWGGKGLQTDGESTFSFTQSKWFLKVHFTTLLFVWLSFIKGMNSWSKSLLYTLYSNQFENSLIS